ncbi:hypothetical protein [Bradyrhizobium ottawaense]|uniref:hypothetical protein n=1 Tax=Bradyrhizobium ottawaense TaxID=931866 RepID=UPI0030F435FF
MTDDALLEQVAKRRVPCLIAYLAPFRIVQDEKLEPWKTSLDEVNGQSWDCVKLHELVGGIDVGMKQPYHLVVSRDGALALPPVEGLRSDQSSVEFFNRCLAGLLIGGVYCEAVSSDGLDLGFILDWKYVRSERAGQSASNRFHQQIRYRKASALDAISLLDPPTARFSDLDAAMKIGLSVLNRIDRLRGDLLLKGVTGIARRDWSAALSNLWIVIEQIVSHLWESRVVRHARESGSAKSRLDQLADNRTWTAAAKLEVLHQTGCFGLNALHQLSMARKARNDLAHEGRSPLQAAALSAFDGMRLLFEASMPEQRLPLFALDLSDHAISDPFAPPKAIGEPRYWMAFPKLPGEEELERLDASMKRHLRSDEAGR